MTADKQSVKLLYYLTTWMTKNPARDTFLRHTSTARVTWTCPWTQALTSRIYLRISKYHKVRRLAIEPLRGVHLAFSSVPSGFLLEWLGPWQRRLRKAESNLRCAIWCKNVDMRAWYSIYRSSQITSRKTDWADVGFLVYQVDYKLCHFTRWIGSLKKFPLVTWYGLVYRSSWLLLLS